MGYFFRAWIPRTPESCLCAKQVCIPGAASLAAARGYGNCLGVVSVVGLLCLVCSGAGMLCYDPQFPGQVVGKMM